MSGEGTLQPSTANRKPSLAYVIVASVVAVLLWLRWGRLHKGIWIDLDVYIRGAAALMRHEPLYGVSVQGQPFTYPPFAALVFVPLELLGGVDARWLLTAASIVSYFVVVVVCAKRLRMSFASAGLVALAGLTIEPFARNILLGQINIVLVAMVVVDCFVVPARYRGMLIGIAAGIKLVPGAFILFLVLKRERAAYRLRAWDSCHLDPTRQISTKEAARLRQGHCRCPVRCDASACSRRAQGRSCRSCRGATTPLASVDREAAGIRGTRW